jgi:hypothetical protein
MATAVLLLVQVPPVFGVTFAEEFWHTSVAPPKVGAPGIALITTLADALEVHPVLLVTINVYVAPAGNELIVVLVVFPVVMIPPGFIVIVQFPLGKLFSITLPDVVHVGCVMVPTTGAVGSALTVTLLVAVQPVDVCVNVKVTGGPPSSPVIKPLLFMEITLGSLLTQVPPVFGVTLAVEPKHTDVAPPNTGDTFTVMSLDALHPVAVSVKEKVTVPVLTPVTTPAFVIVAILTPSDSHVPPVEGVKLVVAPTQAEIAPPKIGLGGKLE